MTGDKTPAQVHALLVAAVAALREGPEAQGDWLAHQQMLAEELAELVADNPPDWPPHLHEMDDVEGLGTVIDQLVADRQRTWPLERYVKEYANQQSRAEDARDAARKWATERAQGAALHLNTVRGALVRAGFTPCTDTWDHPGGFTLRKCYYPNEGAVEVHWTPASRIRREKDSQFPDRAAALAAYTESLRSKGWNVRQRGNYIMVRGALPGQESTGG